MSAPNWPDCGPLLLDALQAQVEVDGLTVRYAEREGHDHELHAELTAAKARALRLREAALARAGVDPLDRMIAHARGVQAS